LRDSKIEYNLHSSRGSVVVGSPIIWPRLGFQVQKFIWKVYFIPLKKRRDNTIQGRDKT
jgi:hypothetical protein